MYIQTKHFNLIYQSDFDLQWKKKTLTLMNYKRFPLMNFRIHDSKLEDKNEKEGA